MKTIVKFCKRIVFLVRWALLRTGLHPKWAAGVYEVKDDGYLDLEGDSGELFFFSEDTARKVAHSMTGEVDGLRGVGYWGRLTAHYRDGEPVISVRATWAQKVSYEDDGIRALCG